MGSGDRKRSKKKKAKKKGKKKKGKRSSSSGPPELVPESSDESWFKVRKWDAVALWSYNLMVDTCAICRNPLADICIDCQSEHMSAEAADCGIAWGTCNHQFHFHCISKW